jgi:signal transduction histidine kinase
VSPSPQRNRRVQVIALAAVLCFASLLGYALYKLSGLQEELRTDVGENMVWAMSQAVYQSGRLYQAALTTPPTAASDSGQILHRNLLKARLVMLSTGAQHRYMQRLGVLPELIECMAMLDQPQLDYDGIQQALLRISNQVMLADRELVGAQRDAHRRLMVQVMLAVLGVLLAGALLCWQLLGSLRRANLSHAEVVQQHEKTRELLDALQQERLTTLRYRDFVSLMSHQLRTPLAVIDSSAQRLLRQRHDGDLVHNVSERAQRVRKSVQQLNQLIGRVLEGLRLDEGVVGGSDLGALELLRCNWREVVAEALERFADLAAQRSVVMRWPLAGSAPLWVECDRMWCVEILCNLLSNADKYSPAMQPIEVTVDVREDMLYCSVRDYGQGIAEEELEQVFERFYRSESTQSIVGIGLGLAIARTLAQWHGGSLTACNASQGGACFTLCIPLCGLDSPAPLPQLVT